MNFKKIRSKEKLKIVYNQKMSGMEKYQKFYPGEYQKSVAVLKMIHNQKMTAMEEYQKLVAIDDYLCDYPTLCSHCDGDPLFESHHAYEDHYISTHNTDLRVVSTNGKIVSWWEDMNRKMARFSDRTDVTCICIPEVKNHDIGWRCHFCGRIEKEKSELVTHLVHCAGDENIWKTEMKNKPRIRFEKYMYVCHLCPDEFETRRLNKLKEHLNDEDAHIFMNLIKSVYRSTYIAK